MTVVCITLTCTLNCSVVIVFALFTAAAFSLEIRYTHEVNFNLTIINIFSLKIKVSVFNFI